MASGERFPFREIARYVPLAIVGGGLIGFALTGFRWQTRSVLHGALIGFTCFAAAVFAEFLFHRWIGDAWWKRAILYFAASQVGWPIGLFLGFPLIHGVGFTDVNIPGRAWMISLICGGIGTLLGVSVYGYELLKERLRRSIEQLKEKEFAEKELELARELQSRMLPAPDIAADGYRISARNFAARYVAGDFYDVFHYPDGAVGIAIADVAGKGMAASLIMASVKAVLPLVAMSRSVDEAMIALNEKLAGELSRREFVALTLARFEPATGNLSLVNAGLPDPYLMREGALQAIEVTGPRMPLGLKRGNRYAQHQLALSPGEAILFFSDGLPEATSRDGELLGYDRLAEIIRQAGPDVDRILARLHAATMDTRDDDQTLVMLART
jgi:hypothetical protein